MPEYGVVYIGFYPLSLASDVAYCFIDTNVLIHFQTFDEVDWPTVFQVDQVCLVLGPVVMAELNQHKDDSSHGWRQKRARMLVGKLSALLKEKPLDQPVEVRQGVSIFDIPKEPVVDWKALGLDPRVNDDRLLASIIEFTNDIQPHAVQLITDDFLAQRKATYQGVTAINPEGLIERIERPSPETKIGRAHV